MAIQYSVIIYVNLECTPSDPYSICLFQAHLILAIFKCFFFFNYQRLMLCWHTYFWGCLCVLTMETWRRNSLSAKQFPQLKTTISGSTPPLSSVAKPKCPSPHKPPVYASKLARNHLRCPGLLCKMRQVALKCDSRREMKWHPSSEPKHWCSVSNRK